MWVSGALYDGWVGGTEWAGRTSCRVKVDQHFQCKQHNVSLSNGALVMQISVNIYRTYYTCVFHFPSDHRISHGLIIEMIDEARGEAIKVSLILFFSPSSIYDGVLEYVLIIKSLMLIVRLYYTLKCIFKSKLQTEYFNCKINISQRFEWQTFLCDFSHFPTGLIWIILNIIYNKILCL